MNNNTNSKKELIKQIGMYIINAVALWGVYLIFYNVNIDIINILTVNMDKITWILTMVGVIFTAISIYLQPSSNPEPVEKFSLLLSAPLVIILAIVTIFLKLFGFEVNYALNGISILGLCGSSIRLFKSTKWWTGCKDITINNDVAITIVDKKSWKNATLTTKTLFVFATISFIMFYTAGVFEFYDKYKYSYIFKWSGFGIFLVLLIILLCNRREK
jgi:hypothetical protein